MFRVLRYQSSRISARSRLTTTLSALRKQIGGALPSSRNLSFLFSSGRWRFMKTPLVWSNLCSNNPRRALTKKGHWGQVRSQPIHRFENSRGAKCEKSDTRRRMSPKSGPKRLRELLQQPGIISSLGAHDVFTALIVEQAGFYALAAVNPLFWTILFWN